MDYYEELGVTPTATEEEIRRAHRRLSKLVHPDQQTDETMRALAETQMRRLNSIVEVLTDPEQRQAYDEQLRQGIMFLPGFSPRPQTAKRHAWGSVPWWVASTAGAVLLTVGVVWLWANNWGSSFGNHSPTYIPSSAISETDPEARAARSDATQPAPDRQPVEPAGDQRTNGRTSLPEQSATARSSQAAPATSSRTVASVPLPASSSRTAVTVPLTAPPSSADVPRPKRTLSLPLTYVAPAPRLAKLQVPPAPGISVPAVEHNDATLPVAALPSAPKLPEPASPPRPVETTAATPAPVKTVLASTTSSLPQNPLAGEWVYAPREPEKKKPGFYPPEFIDLKLFSDNGVLRGEYRARYEVTDRPISPDVTFALTPEGANKFVWESKNGSRGTFKISSISPSVIRVEWRTTVYSRQPALTAGTATLVRRAQ